MRGERSWLSAWLFGFWLTPWLSGLLARALAVRASGSVLGYDVPTGQLARACARSPESQGVSHQGVSRKLQQAWREPEARRGKVQARSPKKARRASQKANSQGESQKT